MIKGSCKVLAALMALVFLLITAPMPAMSAESTVDLAVNPTSGQVGDSVTVSGTGLYLGPLATVKLYFTDQEVDLSGNDDKYVEDELSRYSSFSVSDFIPESETGTCSFTKDVAIPQSLNTGSITTYGNYYFYLAKLTSIANKYVILAGTPFTISGFYDVALTPVQGNVGQEVVIAGEGFTPGEDIQVLFAGVDITAEYVDGEPEALSDGTFSVVVPVPAAGYGEKEVTVVGETSGIQASATFNVLPKITLSPSFGESGSTVVATGSGFSQNADIYFEDVFILSASVEDGGFTEEIEIPAELEFGTYTVTAQDPLTPDIISASTSFEVTDPLVAPELLQPSNAEQDVPVAPTFSWGTVAVAVSYDFQLSTDPGFDNDVLVDVNVADTFYEHASPELESDTYYYWRVRAVGEDEEASPWSILRNMRTAAEPSVPVETTLTVTVTAPPVTSTVTVTSPPQTITQTQPPVTLTKTSEVIYTTTAPGPTTTMTQAPVTLTQTEVVEQPPVTVTQTIEPTEPAGGKLASPNWAMIAMFLGGAVMAAGGIVILIDRIRY